MKTHVIRAASQRQKHSVRRYTTVNKMQILNVYSVVSYSVQADQKKSGFGA